MYRPRGMQNYQWQIYTKVVRRMKYEVKKKFNNLFVQVLINIINILLKAYINNSLIYYFLIGNVYYGRPKSLATLSAETCIMNFRFFLKVFIASSRKSSF